MSKYVDSQQSQLVWLNVDDSGSQEEYKKAVPCLKPIVKEIMPFTNATQCIDFLKADLKPTLIIVSGSFTQQLVSNIQSYAQVESIYVLCDNESPHENWFKTVPKLKGVYMRIETICEELKSDFACSDPDMIPISFKGIDSLFMYTQLLKEIILDVDYDNDVYFKEFLAYCHTRAQQRNRNDTIFTKENISKIKADISKIEAEYSQKTPIWWYTYESFMYRILNQALRLMEVDILIKMAFFIKALHMDIKELYHEQQSSNNTKNDPFKVLRGQWLSQEVFNKLEKTKGGLMSFNNFLSTTEQYSVARRFVDNIPQDSSLVRILFVMSIDPNKCAASGIPFADVKDVSCFKGKEAEILFSTHTIFRIDDIQMIEHDETYPLWQVDLTFTGNDNHEFTELSKHLRKELNANAARGLSRLGLILIKIGEAAKARQYYETLLEQARSDKERIDYNILLGSVYDDMGEYVKALSYYKEALKIQKHTLSNNDPDLAISYCNIGSMHFKLKQYKDALSNYDEDLKISGNTLHQMHPNLAISYHNRGNLHAIMGKYAEALSSYEKGLSIDESIRPKNDPELAIAYINMGAVYDRIGDYSNALSCHKKAIEIQGEALPGTHPALASGYNNIGVVYFNIGEYLKARTYYEKALEILKKTLPETHSDVLEAKNNIEMVQKGLS